MVWQSFGRVISLMLAFNLIFSWFQIRTDFDLIEFEPYLVVLTWGGTS